MTAASGKGKTSRGVEKGMRGGEPWDTRPPRLKEASPPRAVPLALEDTAGLATETEPDLDGACATLPAHAQ